MNFEYHLMFDVASAKYQQNLRGDIKDIHQHRSGSRVPVNMQHMFARIHWVLRPEEHLHLLGLWLVLTRILFRIHKKSQKSLRLHSVLEGGFKPIQIHEMHVLFPSHVWRC